MILELLLGLPSVENLVEPTKEVGKTEVVVGTLGPRMRALYTVIRRQEELLEAKKAEKELLVKQMGPPGTILKRLAELAPKVQALIALDEQIEVDLGRLDFLGQVYVLELIEEFSAPEGYVLKDVRNGWVVVSVPVEEAVREMAQNCAVHGPLLKAFKALAEKA